MSQTESTTAPRQDDSFAAAMSRAAFRRMLVALAATGATAATAYLTRKTREVWDEKAAPRIEEKGGLEAMVKEAFAKASDVLGSVSDQVVDSTHQVVDSSPVSAVTEKVEEVVHGDSGTDEPKNAPVETISTPEREAERRERQKRRESRQRALKRSGAT